MERFKELEIPVNVDFTPKDVKFPKYTLQNTLGKAEAEEMVARFLEFWQENDEWKAVSAKDVCERIEEQAKDIHKTNNEVFTLMILDVARVDNGPNFVEIGMKYLFGKQYINTQRYGEGNNIAIYVAPTEKLLNAIRPFVQKGTYQHLNSGCIKPLFFKINNTNNYGLFTIKIYLTRVRNINKHCQTKKKVRYLMKKTLKIIGITLAVIVAIVIMLFEVAAFDGYINSKVDRVQTAVQATPTSITIPTNLGYSASTYCIELKATPDEFKDYFENVIAKDTINQIMISGQRIGNDTRKIKWAIVYNNYKPMQGFQNQSKSDLY